jgi:twitching motility protein PilT
MARIDDLFALQHDRGASDLHLFAGSPPALRVRGDMEKIADESLDDDELQEMLFEILTPHQRKEIEETGDLDFGYEVPGIARYRCNYFKQKNGIGAVFREIPSTVLTVDQLGLPQVLKQLAMLPRGLVLLTGPTGSGKSTTLAAIIEHANANRKCHIVTIEDPIEFVHHPKQCIINHREVETHTQTFSKALRAALREDPDIILVGEMRDLETTMLAIEAANTGHLVLSTMHTMGATRTIDRIVDMFPADQQSQIRTSLSESLKGVMSQALFKRVDKPGRIAALEILLVTPAASNLIREQKTYQLMTVIQTGRRLGMMSLDDAIADLLQRRLISPEEAFEKAVEKDRFAKLLKAPPPDF